MISNIKKMRFEDIIGEDTALKKQIEIAQKAASLDVPVLIEGETGTGKELFARAIHYQSKRGKSAYIAENCSAVPHTLAESVFFGTERGAFTDAKSQKGLFELANGGTLLLDELNSMPLDIQPKILRALQENTIRRLGGLRDIPINVRIIATINEDTESLLASGRLRKDLYYRLNVIHIEIPALREHKQDIPLYIDFFLKRYNERYEKNFRGFSDDAISALQGREYPGNVRELENLIEKAVAMCDEKEMIQRSDLY